MLLGSALLLSHLLCRALAERPFATSDAPAWFEATARMARAKLAEAAAGAPKDTLQLPAALLAAVLSRGNPVAEVSGALECSMCYKIARKLSRCTLLAFVLCFGVHRLDVIAEQMEPVTQADLRDPVAVNFLLLSRSCCAWQREICRHKPRRRGKNGSGVQLLSWPPSLLVRAQTCCRHVGSICNLPVTLAVCLAGHRRWRIPLFPIWAPRATRTRLPFALCPPPDAEEEWPDAAEIKAARRAEQDAKTPVPERCWALRNVAGWQGGHAALLVCRVFYSAFLCWTPSGRGIHHLGKQCDSALSFQAHTCHAIIPLPIMTGTLSMGGAGERARARQLLEQAVLLKQQFAGAADHPGARMSWLHGINACCQQQCCHCVLLSPWLARWLCLALYVVCLGFHSRMPLLCLVARA